VLVSPNSKGQTILSVGATPRFLKAAVGEATVSGDRIAVELPDLQVYGDQAPRFTLRAGDTEIPSTVSENKLEAERPKGAETVEIGYDGRGWRHLVDVPKSGLLGRLRGR
jgi:hypothetical protein